MLQEGKKRGLEIMLKAHFPYEFSRNTTGSGHSGKKKRRHNAACKKPQCGSCLQGDRREQGRVNSHQEEPRLNAAVTRQSCCCRGQEVKAACERESNMTAGIATR
jgi:hypothetical protein